MAATPRRDLRPKPLLVGAAACAILAVAGIFAPRAVLHGWLIAFASVGGIPLGATALVAVHRLTGGRWGTVSGDLLRTAAAALPLLLLLCLPLLFAAKLVYPWAADPHAAGPGVAERYLNVASLGLRSLLGLGGLGVLAFVEVRARRFGRLTAGLTLVLYAVFMDLTAYDWILSLEPRFVSSAFGAQLVVQQLLSALAFVVVALRTPADDPVWGAFGALLLAIILGETYLVFMSFIVNWYGDQPPAAAWYLRRTEHGWLWLEIAGSVVGFLGPLLLLLIGRVRTSRAALRFVGASVLLGVFLLDVWLIAPVTGGAAGIAALLATVAIGTLLWGGAPGLFALAGGDADGR